MCSLPLFEAKRIHPVPIPITKTTQDWAAAIEHVRGPLAAAGAVDAGRLALWGTSYAGGHALVTAARLGDDVKAVVAQVPFLDGRAALERAYKQRGLPALLRSLAAGLHDALRGALGMPAAYLPIAGGLKSHALMRLDERELNAYFEKHPKVYQVGAVEGGVCVC